MTCEIAILIEPFPLRREARPQSGFMSCDKANALILSKANVHHIYDA